MPSDSNFADLSAKLQEKLFLFLDKNLNMCEIFCTFAIDREERKIMPRKNSGMWYEVHPTPVKGDDGRNIVYVRPKSGMRLTMKQLEGYCERNYSMRYGELSRAFDIFVRAAGEFLAKGYRIDTPIGSFAPKLSLTKQVTDPDQVKDRDVRLDGVEYNPGKLWNREMEKWHDGFRKAITPDTQAILADKEKLEQQMRECL